MFYVRRGEREGGCNVVFGAIWSKSYMLRFNRNYLLRRRWKPGNGRDGYWKMTLLPYYTCIIFHVRRGERDGICKVVFGVMWSKSNLLKLNRKYLLCRGWATGSFRDEQRKLSLLPHFISNVSRGERDGGCKDVHGEMWSKSNESRLKPELSSMPRMSNRKLSGRAKEGVVSVVSLIIYFYFSVL